MALDLTGVEFIAGIVDGRSLRISFVVRLHGTEHASESLANGHMFPSDR